MIEVTLSDGSILTLPPDTTDEGVQNFVSRAERQLGLEKGYGDGIVGGAMNATSAGLTGFNKGVANTLGLPVDLMNAGLGKLGLPVSDRPFLGSQQIKDWMTNTNMIQPNRGWDMTEKFGENLGAGAMLAFTGGAAAPMLAARGMTTGAAVANMMGPGSTVGGTIAREGIGALGQTLGGAAAEAIAPDSKLASMLGQMAGGIAPAAVSAMGKNAIQKVWAKPDGQSREAYDALVEAGITPRPGLVGNKGMARVENTYAQFPIAGYTPMARMGESFDQFQHALYGAADEVAPLRAGRAAETAPTEDMVGGMMRESAKSGKENLKGYFSNLYDRFFNQVPNDVLVTPNALNREVAGQNSVYTGESMGTRNSVNGFVEGQIDPLTTTRSTYSEYGPVTVEKGVPIQPARKARTEAFYDAQGGNMQSGATEQVRQAWTTDIEHALMNDPQMIRAFPDPAARQAHIERLRTIDTERAMASATDVSRAGAEIMPDRMVVGGDFPALDRVANAVSDRSAFNMGSEPGHMAVLQRTDPGNYPEIAAETIRQRAQANVPYGNTNVSPQNFSKWWESMSPNERAIYTNEGFDPRRTIPLDQPRPAPDTPIAKKLDNLAYVGNLFRQRGMEANASGTAPTLATLGVGTGLFTNPGKTLVALGSGLLGGRAVSSETLAEILAGIGPTASQQIGSAAARTAGRTGVNMERP